MVEYGAGSVRQSSGIGHDASGEASTQAQQYGNHKKAQRDAAQNQPEKEMSYCGQRLANRLSVRIRPPSTGSFS